jgi:alanine-synthesizing transaminase
MNLIYNRLTAIPGITCVKPKGALYVFPKIDLRKFDFKSDEDFIFELLSDQKVLVVAGTGFNYIHNDHFRIVTLPSTDELTIAMDRMEHFLDNSRIHASSTVEEYLV